MLRWVGVSSVVLRGRRRERRYSNVGSRFSGLTGRRGRISELTARRPLPVVKSPADNPQPIDAADHLSAGENRNVLMSSWDRSEGSRMYATPILKRAVSLTSDAIVLTLASPFFVAWWLVRTLRNRR
jgi:hypothetical protein